MYCGKRHTQNAKRTTSEIARMPPGMGVVLIFIDE